MSEIFKEDFELYLEMCFSGVAPCLPEGGALEVSTLSSLKLTLNSFTESSVKSFMSLLYSDAH